MKRYSIGVTALAYFIGAILLANMLTEHYGMVDVGFGLTTTAGTYAAGAALLLRDVVHDHLGRYAVIAGIVAGAALTGLTAPALAAASAAAFLVSELADMEVYTPLRDRGWVPAVLTSNVVGAVIDTYLFLWLAGFPVTAEGVGGQLVGKLVWATLLPVVLVLTVRQVRRAVTA